MFDLGGVILDNDFSKSITAFAKLGVDIAEIVSSTDFWQELDNNDNYTLAEFSTQLRKYSPAQPSDTEIEQAWTALLTDFLPERMALLEKLAQHYKLYLFSNTDAIHVKCFEEKCRQQFHRELSSYFMQVFYSNELGLRKPDPASFEKVLAEANILPQETLFIDDKLENVASARQVGLFAYQLIAPETLLDLDFAKIIGE